jgi:hypothetical protein
MHMLKSVFQVTVNLAKRAFRLAQFAAVAIKPRRRRSTLNALEAERLDRIRNPAKHLEKG